MTRGLEIGRTIGGGAVKIPLDEVTKATAILGIRESGKSCLGTVMAEELIKASQPWIALDPVGNWWGLRAKPDGSAGGYQVVVFGGERADLPIEKGDGRKIAEAVTSTHVCAVIDLKGTSKTLWRTFVRDFVGALLEINVTVPRKVFIEEAPEFIPQTASYQLGRECSEIVERLVTLGGNYGYGATLLGQRSASISKDALTQCETVFAFATQSSHDRDAYKNWIKSVQAKLDEEMLTSLADLETGVCYLWSPRFLKMFEKITVRRRETFHPRDARKLGLAMRDVELTPVDDFVAKVRKQLTKTSAPVPGPSHLLQAAEDITELAKNPKLKRVLLQANAGVANALAGAQEAVKEHQDRIAELALENGRLKSELSKERAARAAADGSLEAARKFLRPQYDALKKVFAEIGEAAPTNGSYNEEAWAPWLAKAGAKGARRALETLLKHGRLKQQQLATLAGISMKGGHWRRVRAFITKNNLGQLDGEDIVAARL